MANCALLLNSGDSFICLNDGVVYLNDNTCQAAAVEDAVAASSPPPRVVGGASSKGGWRPRDIRAAKRRAYEARRREQEKKEWQPWDAIKFDDPGRHTTLKATTPKEKSVPKPVERADHEPDLVEALRRVWTPPTRKH
jgi:hypothetical protein